MGSSYTWHGIPDARIRTSYGGDANVIATNTENYTSSDGDSIVVEAKTRFKEQDISQLIALGVISSFTEHNLHPTLNSMVPSVLINSSTVLICLYDCTSDILLLTEQVQLVDLDEIPPKMNLPAIWLLWLMIHHR